jgi:hypothetical protein
MKRRNEGCSHEKAKGVSEDMGDFHGTIFVVLVVLVLMVIRGRNSHGKINFGLNAGEHPRYAG